VVELRVGIAPVGQGVPTVLAAVVCVERETRRVAGGGWPPEVLVPASYGGRRPVCIGRRSCHAAIAIPCGVACEVNTVRRRWSYAAGKSITTRGCGISIVEICGLPVHVAVVVDRSRVIVDHVVVEPG